jgi:hypothetical protein
MDEIVANAGSLYDPTVVDACVALVRNGFEFDPEVE